MYKYIIDSFYYIYNKYYLIEDIKEITHNVEQTAEDIKEITHNVEQTAEDIKEITHNVEQTAEDIKEIIKNIHTFTSNNEIIKDLLEEIKQFNIKHDT
jgi:methyl-accepting chemotaxis protein